ncbi:alpha-amylase family glycosyl hydrolase [Acidimangrovimonas sediminis]|uniref:alpha-amylase family glycosyl hydrolase n=1 Tax=Acidimangrovimonas sediminis TaxID=2056283 RepID=UPI000C7FDBB2|nr:alpha-amylase family glycosyl hydrolase [Acidimangrovimonas sediminis]
MQTRPDAPASASPAAASDTGPAGSGSAGSVPRQLRERLEQSLAFLYPDADVAALTTRVLDSYWPGDMRPRRRGRVAGNTLWDQRDNYMITYGNSIVDGSHKPLDLLRHFASRYLAPGIRGIHVLPYFPFTSDDGFAVTDYYAVNSQLGAWEDITRIAGEFRLMSDLVLNHCSSQSSWFSSYRQGHAPYDKFFREADPNADLSEVVRPRAHALLREVQTANGPRHVWCTFSHDQVDFDFANPEVLIEFLKVLRFHVDMGVRTVRLDAVAYVWKQEGTSCIHLPQTHAIVRLLRLIADHDVTPIVLITETNVPNAENLSYFGNRNEAHVVYNFSLPPLILHALLNGTSRALRKWQMAMPPAQLGCAYLNFTASHDGIGLRPAEGVIPPDELATMVKTVQGFGGLLSMRRMSDGSEKPYELNVALFDALKGTVAGEDDLQIPRFLCSQAVAMALEGIPAFYIHSLIATGNDTQGVEKQGYNRAINRKRWDYGELRALLDNPETPNHKVLKEMMRMIRIRSSQPAFHPNATQFTLQLGDEIFGFWRQSLDRAQSIFVLANVTDREVTIPALSLNLIDGRDWSDLLTGDKIHETRGEITLAPYQSRWISNGSA